MNGRIYTRDAWARKSHWFVAASGAVLAVLLTPGLANSAPCKSEDWKEFDPLQGCPAEFSCLQITLQPGEVDDSNLRRRTVNLPRDCSYKGVRFKITRSNTILDCQGETLEQPTGTSYQKDIAVLVHGIQSFRQYPDPNLSCEQQGASNDCEDPGAYACRFPVPESCSLTRTPLHDVTVRHCKIRNYNVGARVQMNSPKASKDLIESTYEKWFHHENERTCRVERIEDCMRAGAPRNIRFEDVDIRNSGNVGFYVFPYIHDTVFAGGVVKDTDKGPGIYLTHGSRNNSIEDSSIKDAYREGVAMDGSAYNRIIRNTIQNNSRHWWEGFPIQRAKKYGAGITLFKNAWEKRRSYADKQRSDPWKDRSPPRTQHAMGNSIEWNKFRDQRYGVWIGYRQNIEWKTSERGDPIYYGGSKEAYFRKYSENTKVIYNTFEKVRVGVRAWDDSATIIGNKFLKPIYAYVNNQKVPMSTAIKVGHNIRRKVSDPVRNTTVAHNNFAPGFANYILETGCTFDNEIANVNFHPNKATVFTLISPPAFRS